jgi:hypothetical protein
MRVDLGVGTTLPLSESSLDLEFESSLDKDEESPSRNILFDLDVGVFNIP